MTLQACEYCGWAGEKFTSAYVQDFLGAWVLAESPVPGNTSLVWACDRCAEINLFSYVSSEPYPGAWADAERFAYNYGLDD
jgi:hypothetical protein